MPKNDENDVIMFSFLTLSSPGGDSELYTDLPFVKHKLLETLSSVSTPKFSGSFVCNLGEAEILNPTFAENSADFRLVGRFRLPKSPR